MNVFVVEMLRWGDDESHHYLVGVLDNLKEAQEVGEIEKSWRSGKYEYRITEFAVSSKHGEIMDCEQISNHRGNCECLKII